MFERIITIVGTPRSGTSWLGQTIDSCPIVVYRYQPIFSYAFKNAVNINSSKEDFEKFFKDIYNSNDDFLLRKDMRKDGHYPIFLKDENEKVLAFKNVRYHYLLEKMIVYFPNLQILGIVRHPCGVLNSWFTNPKEFPVGADPLNEWRYGKIRNIGPEEFWGFEKWKELTHMFIKFEREFPKQFKIVIYGKMVEKPIEVAKEIFEFVKLDFTDQTEKFLESSHKIHDDNESAVFKDKKVKDKWQWELDKRIQKEIISELEGTILEQFLY